VPGADALNDDAPDDDALLRRSAGGDGAAFDLFVDRHAAAVLHFARNLTRDEDRAADVFQETFVAAWRGAGGFRGGSARAWLLTIARNATHRQRRTRAGEPRDHESLDELAQRAGWGADHDDVLRRLEARDLLERGLAALDDDDREILLLRELEGLSGAEAAAALGITLEAQKSRLHRARLRFIASLRGVDHGG
jgi:RNA polymerase sigma-70 factor (ECF subfamily)